MLPQVMRNIPKIDAHFSAGVAPHQSAFLQLETLPSSVRPGSYLNLEFSLAKSTSWARAGHVVATGQVELVPPTSLGFWHQPSHPLKSPPTVQKVTESQAYCKLLAPMELRGSLTWLSEVSRHGPDPRAMPTYCPRLLASTSTVLQLITIFGERGMANGGTPAFTRRSPIL